MQKITIMCLAWVLSVSFAHAQDNPTSLREISGELSCLDDTKKSYRIRIMAGPTLNYMLNSKEGFGKGMTLGSMAGVELNYRVGNRTYLICGSSLNTYSYEEWLNARDGRSVSHSNLSVEIPLGIGYNFGKDIPKGFFANLSFANNFTLTSKSVYQTNVFQGLIVNGNIENPHDLYSFGARLEFGHKGLLHEKYYTSFSGIIKPMILNSSSVEKSTTIFNIGIVGSVYFY